ncbi:MAG: LysE family transporter [Patescibacteria group bacterium]|nr:LysE family transporter [Patescibacteria group bacterium]
MEKRSVFLNGLITGFILQFAVGPAFFFVISLSLQKTVFDGIAGAGGVAFADYFYITLAIVGVGKLLTHKKVRKTFGVISSVVLILFGVMIIKSITGENISTDAIASPVGILSSFTAALLLTISSPLTIVTVTSLFTVKALEYNYTKHDLVIFGVAMGLSTFLFMGSSAIVMSLIKNTVPISFVQVSNAIVALLLIGYGGIRLVKIVK